MLAEMGVAIGVDGHTVGLFQPRRVMCVVMCCVLDDGLPHGSSFCQRRELK